MPDNKPPDEGYQASRQMQGSAQQQQAQQAAADLAALIQKLSAAGGVPVALSVTPLEPIDTGARLNGQPRQTVAFPPCSNELLALYKSTDTDELTKFFNEYFKFRRHQVFGQELVNNRITELDTQVAGSLDSELYECLEAGLLSSPESPSYYPAPWPSECCICTPCVTLDGNRNPPPTQSTTIPSLKRLFIGDVVWLYFFERMGIHQILGAILDAFAYNGRLPISNGRLLAGVRDDITALVLEVMVRQAKMGMSSTVRDRNALYRTSLGWSHPSARELNMDTEVSRGFSDLFHKFIFNALEFYKDKRLAVAIQGTAGGDTPPSVATLITIRDTLDLLKRRFETFDYGRNYYNALSGIVWTVAGMSVIRELVGTLGIPTAFGAADEFIPAAYNVLVLKRPATQAEPNRFLVHRDCATNGRDILLDLEVIDVTKANPRDELERWLTQIESKVEGYRTAYRTLTGVDLGASATPVIEQQV